MTDKAKLAQPQPRDGSGASVSGGGAVIRLATRVVVFAGLLLTLLCPLQADTLVFADGDRVQGKLVSQEGGIIVFASNRFGELRVPEADAVIERGEPPNPAIAAEVAVMPPAAADTSALPRLVRPVVATQRAWLRWWVPWKGRIALALEMSEDPSPRDTFVVDSRLEREWSKDEVKLESHYEYREEEKQKTMDLLRGTAYWRHDIPGNWFGLYRSTVESNRYSFYEERYAPYVMMQQEIGVGYTFLDRNKQKVRAGVSENFFNAWVRKADIEWGERIESVFCEVDVHMPWSTRLSERGVFYYSIQNGTNGWENTLELNRQLTKSISLGLRHEYRENAVDPRLQDYRRLRFLIGYDF